jgi:hypothetical protein
MKAETKARREKMKEKLLDIHKEVKKSKKERMSTAEMNKAMLDMLTKKEDETPEINNIQELEKKKEKHRKFKCTECGIEISLYGEAEPDKEGLCYSCSHKNDVIYE